jgi:hypothetical protein
MKKPIVFALVIVVCAAGLSIVLARQKVESFKDKNVVAGEVRNPFKTFFAHLSEDQYLTVGGKTYFHVRGAPPFYLDVTNLESIVFVTGVVDQEATFHVYNLRSKIEKIIEGGPGGLWVGHRHPEKKR